MRAARFLFPDELEMTPLSVSRIMFIGSCLAEAYVVRGRQQFPSIHFDFVLFNNAMDLPERSQEELRSIDYQYIQLPVRHLLTDGAVRIADFAKSERVEDLFEVAKRNLDLMLEKALAYNEIIGIPTFISNFIVPQQNVSPSYSDMHSDVDISQIICRLNTYLAEKCRAKSNVFVADVEAIAASLGKRYFLDDTISFITHGSIFYDNWHHFENDRIEPVTPIGESYENRADEFFEAVFRQMHTLYRAYKQLDLVKVVIFDLDNTLWRGQLVDDYVNSTNAPPRDGWPLGVWDAVNQLRWRGIATAISSKNDEQIVDDNWESIVYPPFVRLEDFVSKRINWSPKHQNLREILDELALTEASAVFVDDNPVERASVKAAFPKMRVIGSDPFMTKRILLWSAETRPIRMTDESKRRETLLAQRIQREQGRAAAKSSADFLDRLGTKVSLWAIESTSHRSFPRILELTNKTNQFNTTGVRWSPQDFEDLLSTEGKVFAFSVDDIYSRYGTVGALFVRAGCVIQFIMSCRVIGMDVEQAVLAEAFNAMGRPREFSGIIKTTASNSPCREVYSKAGLKRSADDETLYVLPSGSSLSRPRSVTVALAD